MMAIESNRSHTPGPWMYRQPETGPHTPAGERENWPFHVDVQGTPGKMDWGQLIAKVWAHWPNGTAESNARLIAAAPELLDALMRCREYVERAAERGEDDARDSLAALNAAVAKAQGGA